MRDPGSKTINCTKTHVTTAQTPHFLMRAAPKRNQLFGTFRGSENLETRNIREGMKLSYGSGAVIIGKLMCNVLVWFIFSCLLSSISNQIKNTLD